MVTVIITAAKEEVTHTCKEKTLFMSRLKAFKGFLILSGVLCYCLFKAAVSSDWPAHTHLTKSRAAELNQLNQFLMCQIKCKASIMRMCDNGGVV